MGIWFEHPHPSPGTTTTVWYWDGTRGWYTNRDVKALFHATFNPDEMRQHGFRVIPDPFAIPDHLRLPEGL